MLSCAWGKYEAEESWELIGSLVVEADIKGFAITSFFFARSPEAPSITRMVFSCISREVDMLSQIWQADR